MYDVFLSYRRSDQALARDLVTALRGRGVRIWWDQDIEGGEDWREAIVDNLTRSRTLVILFSEDCNDSKQLKKELAIADSLDKDVVPILIEDTKPRGHYLYELATRNWLQAFPDAHTKVNSIADRLARELELAPPPAASASAAPTEPAAAPAPQVERRPALSPADLPSDPDRAEQVALKARQRARDRRDVLALKWYELLIAVGVGALTAFGTLDQKGDSALAAWDFLLGTVMSLMVIAVLVLPFRYYFRRRRVWRAVRAYALSNLALAIVMGLLIGVHPDTYDPAAGGLENLAYGVIGSIVVVGVLSVVAFSIYGLLHFQRTVRSFRRHIEAV